MIQKDQHVACEAKLHINAWGPWRSTWQEHPQRVNSNQSSAFQRAVRFKYAFLACDVVLMLSIYTVILEINTFDTFLGVNQWLLINLSPVIAVLPANIWAICKEHVQSYMLNNASIIPESNKYYTTASRRSTLPDVASFQHVLPAACKDSTTCAISW